jgi:hypothetical protein
MSRSTEVGIVYPASDLRPGRAQSAELSFTTAGAVATIRLPAGTLGVALYPSPGDVRFALDAIPELVTVAEDLANVTLTPGAVAKRDTWTRRSLPADEREHFLYVLSPSDTTAVSVEVW